MRTLVAKDLRLLMPLIITAAVGTVLLHLVVDSSMLLSQRQAGRMLSGRDIMETWVATCGINLFCMIPFCATIGGMSFAHERRERWAEFAAMLPVSRSRAVTIKLVTGVGVSIGIGLFQFGMLFGGYALLCWWFPEAAGQYGLILDPRHDRSWPQLVACAAAAFGTAWLLSALLSGAVWPTVGGIGVLLAGLTVAILIFDGGRQEMQWVLVVLLLLTAVAAVGIGSAVQTLRRTP